MDEQIKEFIEENVLLINSTNKYDWEDLYNRAKQELDDKVGEFTQILLNCDIDPLNYLSNIPSFYLHSINKENIIIPDKIKFIGGAAFANNQALKSIVIPSNIHEIGYRAFRDCHNLKEIKILGNNITIEPETFLNSHNTKELYLSKQVKEIQYHAFYNCYKLTEIIYEGTPKEFKNIHINRGAFDTDTDQYIQRHITFIGDNNNRSDFNLYVK